MMYLTRRADIHWNAEQQLQVDRGIFTLNHFCLALQRFIIKKRYRPANESRPNRKQATFATSEVSEGMGTSLHLCSDTKLLSGRI